YRAAQGVMRDVAALGDRTDGALHSTSEALTMMDDARRDIVAGKPLEEPRRAELAERITSASTAAQAVESDLDKQIAQHTSPAESLPPLQRVAREQLEQHRERVRSAREALGGADAALADLSALRGGSGKGGGGAATPWNNAT